MILRPELLSTVTIWLPSQSKNQQMFDLRTQLYLTSSDSLQLFCLVRFPVFWNSLMLPIILSTICTETSGMGMGSDLMIHRICVWMWMAERQWLLHECNTWVFLFQRSLYFMKRLVLALLNLKVYSWALRAVSLFEMETVYTWAYNVFPPPSPSQVWSDLCTSWFPVIPNRWCKWENRCGVVYRGEYSSLLDTEYLFPSFSFIPNMKFQTSKWCRKFTRVACTQ